MVWGLDIASLMYHPNQTGMEALPSAIGALNSLAAKKEQAREFDQEQALRVRQQQDREYVDQRDFNQDRAKERFGVVDQWQTERNTEGADKDVVDGKYAELFRSMGLNVQTPADMDALAQAHQLAQQTGADGPPEVAPEGGKPVTTPDTPAQPTSKATGQPQLYDTSQLLVPGHAPPPAPAPVEPADDSTMNTYADSPAMRAKAQAASVADAKAAQGVAGVMKPGMKPKPMPAPSLEAWQQMLDYKTPTEPDMSVQPPDEVQEALKSPTITPEEFKAQGSPAPITEDWKKAPIRPVGMTVMDPSGRIIAQAPPGDPLAEQRQRLVTEAEKVIPNIPDPKLKSIAEGFVDAVKNGTIRTHKDLQWAETFVASLMRTDVNALAAKNHGKGSGAEERLGWIQGSEAVQKRLDKDGTTQLLAAYRDIPNVRDKLKSGNLSEQMSAVYGLARMAAPGDRITDADFRNAQGRSLWDKIKDSVYGNAPMPELNPEETARLAEVVDAFERHALPRLKVAFERARGYAKAMPHQDMRDGGSANLDENFSDMPFYSSAAPAASAPALPAPTQQFPNRPQ